MKEERRRGLEEEGGGVLVRTSSTVRQGGGRESQSGTVHKWLGGLTDQSHLSTSCTILSDLHVSRCTECVLTGHIHNPAAIIPSWLDASTFDVGS